MHISWLFSPRDPFLLLFHPYQHPGGLQEWYKKRAPQISSVDKSSHCLIDHIWSIAVNEALVEFLGHCTDGS